MKKIIIGIGILVILPVTLLLLTLVSLNKLITEDFIVSQLEKNMNLRAEVKRIDISIFSAISGITIEGFKLTKRDYYADNAVPLGERKSIETYLILIDNFDFQLNFLAILKGEVQLKKLLLKNPQINMIIYENGGNNLSSLFNPPRIIQGKLNPILDVKEEPNAKIEEEESDTKPFSIKDIPLSASLKEIGIQSGTVNIVVKKTEQILTINSLNLIINSIDINPEDLKNHNSIQVDFNFVLQIKSLESKQERAKLLFSSNALISPFIPTTGFINPFIDYKLIVKKDSYVEGMALFDSITNSIPVLKNALIEPKGLSDKAILLENVNTEVQYGSGKITLKQAVVFHTKNFDLEINKGSSIFISTNQHEFLSSIKFSKEESDKSLENLKKIKLEKPEIASVIDSILSKITREDKLYLPFKSSGDLNNPEITLNVEIPSIIDSIKGVILNKAGEELQKQIDKNLPGAGAVIKKLF